MISISGVSRIYVLKAQALFRKALCQMFALDSAFQVVGDGETIVPATIAAAKPDALLVDIDGIPGDVCAVIASCREAVPNAKICALSMRAEPELVHRCLGATADGFVIKDVSPAELVNAMKIVMTGVPYVDPRAAGRLLRMRSHGGRGDISELSNREMDIVRLVADGLSNKEISSRLYVSEKTVKNHMGRIFSKLNINTRSQAAVYAIKNGIVG